MTDTQASQLSGCDDEVPMLGVTREFDFGQFIELFDATADPLHPEVPSLSRVVIQPSSTLAADRNAVTGDPRPPAMTQPSVRAVTRPGRAAARAAEASSITPPGQSPGEPAGPEVNLFDLVDAGPGAKLAPLDAEIAEAAAFFKDGRVTVDGRVYVTSVDAGQREALSTGMTVTVYGVPDGGRAGVPLSLSLPFTPAALDAESLPGVLAGGQVSGAGLSEVTPALTPAAVRVLLDGGTVLTHGVDAKGRKSPISLQVTGATGQKPLSDSFQVFDIPSFVANPAVLSGDGEWLDVDLQADDMRLLLAGETATMTAGGHTISVSPLTDRRHPDYVEFLARFGGAVEATEVIALKPSDVPWKDLLLPEKFLRDPYFVRPGKHGGLGFTGSTAGGSGTGGGTTTPAAKSMTDVVQPRLPSGSGLPVAVFVPWKQIWTLTGFSRGNLLNSIALAPSEQVTMQVFSWERRSRTLEQSAETDIDQQTDVTQSTRDTEDVFKEMIAKRDFAWQVSGSLDASYSPGVASIQVHAEGGVSQTDSITQTARTSGQSVREATVKASSRVRSRRITRVTQSVESGREERVTRVIQNPNQCHTLNLDFFETLAHYEITLKFVKESLRLVVLVPNPVRTADYTSEIVRRNETALRNALIETALEDGFDACRLVAAYDEARAIVSRQKSEAAKVDEPAAQRDTKADTGFPDQAAPQLAEVERVAAQFVKAVKAIRADAGIDDALRAIGRHEPVTETMRRRGQQWLFVNFCAAKFPSLLAVLDDIAGGGVTGIAAAQQILAVLPRPDAPTNLGNLNQMADKEKEECAYSGKLREERPKGTRLHMKMDWDWAWWTGRLREEGLYSANDGGLAGTADALQKAYQAWEAKKVQGEAMKDQEVVKTEAQGAQEKTTTDDKLAMAFPLEDLARAYERMKVLLGHLNDHREFYNYALFQALPPTEQSLRLLQASNGKLQVGLFEPRAVAMSGDRLVIPLTPLAGSEQLQNFVTSLRTDLEAAFAETLTTPDTTVLPTPGVSVSSRLGACSGCEGFIEESRRHELVRLEALARQELLEAERRAGRIAAKNYDGFDPPPSAVRLELESRTTPPS